MTVIDLQMIINNSKRFLTNDTIHVDTRAHVFILMLNNIFLIKKNMLVYII